MTVPTINAELMLLSWRESSSGGASITLAIDAEGLERFKALTAAKNGKGGQRLMGVFALIGDDETPQPFPPATAASTSARTSARTSCEVPPVHDEQPRPTVGERAADPLGPRATLAVRLCGTEAFVEWLRHEYDVLMGGDGSGWGDIHHEAFPGRTERVRMQAWAKHALLVICGCETTRRELDSKDECGRLFEQRIRRPWVEHVGATA